VAVKAVNVRSRARIETLEMHLLGRQVEHERYVLLLESGTRRAVLRQRWNEVLEAALQRAYGS
jgi:hypothetical protein